MEELRDFWMRESGWNEILVGKGVVIQGRGG